MKTRVIGLDDGTKSYLGRKDKPEISPKEELAKNILRNWERMKTVRRKTEALRWEACAYVKHRQAEFSTEDSPIKPVNLYNSSGVAAFEVFVDGYHGNLISPSIRWFKLTFIGDNFENADEIYGAMDYLELCENQMFAEFNKSSFYPADKLATRDAAVQGTSAELILDDVVHGMSIFDVLPPWDFWIEKNHLGRIDTLYYQYKLTAQESKERFGDKIPREIEEDLKSDNAKNLHTFVLAVYPRRKMLNRTGKPMISTSKDFAAVTLCLSSQTIIDESGYDDFPFAVHVWEPDGTGPYGKGIVMKYIEELKMLNAMSREEIIGTQKMTNPPMSVPENMKGRFSTDPGARNYTNNPRENRPEIMQTVQDIAWVNRKIVDLENKIRKLFYNDLFNYLMQQDKVLTATQVRAIKNEELVLLSSVLGSTQHMKINPIVKRTFRIMSRAGRLPKPPQELIRLKNPLLRVELDGPLARNINSLEMETGLQGGLEWTMRMKELGFEDALDNLDVDKFFRMALTASGTPQTAIHELADRDVIRQQRMQLMQQQMQMQQLEQASEIQRNLGGRANINNPEGQND